MINIIGRVTKDLEPQTSTNGVKFVSFDVAENKGYGDKAKTQFHRCTVWGEEEVSRIVKARVQKGSLLNVVGDQDLSAYVKATTGEFAASSNITVWHWDYVQVGAKRTDDTGNAVASGTDGYQDVPTEDCDDGLPV